MALTTIPPKRDLTVTSLLDDLECHLPAGHWYVSRDKINYAHEGTHGVNAEIRNAVGRPNNAAYLLGDRAWVMAEPETTLSVVARRVPASLRGGGYKLYLIKQRRYWNNQPLYLLDEWSAYRNGTLMGDEARRDNRDVSFSFSKQIELLGYLFTLCGTVQHEGLLSALVRAASITRNMLKLGRWNGWATPELETQLDHVLTFWPMAVGARA
jgi:hypothetical protein